MGTNPWLALAHITGPLNIPGGMAKSATRKKLILLLRRDICQAISEKDKNVIRKTYPSDKQYLTSPETKESRNHPDTFIRGRDDVGSCDILEGFFILLIQIRIRGDRKRETKRGFKFSINVQFYAPQKRTVKINIVFRSVGGKTEKANLSFHVVRKMGDREKQV